MKKPIYKIDIESIAWEGAGKSSIGRKINELIDRLSALEVKVKKLEDPVKTYFIGDAGYEVHKDTVTTAKQEWCTCKKPNSYNVSDETGISIPGVCYNCGLPIQPKEDTKELRERVKNLENFYEYGPREDTFGDGWNRAIKEVLKIVK